MTDSEIIATTDNNNNNDTISGTDVASNDQQAKRPVTKEKLRSIMEAASALTALGDEDSTGGSAPPSPKREDGEDDEAKREEDDKADALKRYIPEHKKPDAALTFPEKLMNLMRFADKEAEGFCIAWLQDGKSFVIRNPDDFTRKVLPKFFKATKFSSFTRKLYRWGFRQVNRGIGPDDPIIFGNEHFQRDDAELMVKMRSVTAASSRRAEQQRTEYSFPSSSKRPLDMTSAYEDQERKRMLLDQLLQQKAASLVSSNLYGASAGGQRMGGLARALRPSLGLGPPPSCAIPLTTGSMPGMMPKRLDLLNPNGIPSSPNLLNNFIPQGLAVSAASAQQYPNASTAEIVNAAINALRFAS